MSTTPVRLTVSFSNADLQSLKTASIDYHYILSEKQAAALEKHLAETGGDRKNPWMLKEAIEHIGAQLNSDGGPTYVEAWHNGSRIEAWHKDGKLHRDGVPSMVARYADGSSREEWHQKGKLHRKGGPASVDKYADGSLAREIWAEEGKHHREGGPAFTEVMDGGRKRIEKWFLHGRPHREGGPADTYHRDGVALKEAWYQNGKLFKLSRGAAVSPPQVSGPKIQSP